MIKQLITYFSLAYLISWVIWFPLYAEAIGMGEQPSFPFLHAIGGLGPMIASFITSYIFSGKEAMMELLRRCIQPKPIIYLGIALFSPFILAIVSMVFNHILSGVPFDLTELTKSAEFPKLGFISFFAYNLLFFGFGEEVGWRGFALPRLQSRFNGLSSAFILTIFWALWHLPLFLYRPGYTSMDIAGIFGWIFSLLTGSILLSWLYNSSKKSILICAIFHSTVDVAFTADFSDQNTMNYMGFLITVWGILTVIIFKPANLSRTKREQL